MFVDFSESCKEEGGGGGGGVSLLGNKDEPIFQGYVLPDQPEILVISYKLFQLKQTHRIMNASFFLLGSVCQEIIVMIIKHHTFMHCTIRLFLNTHKPSSIFPLIKCNSSLPY